jgi:hypothetical protein
LTGAIPLKNSGDALLRIDKVEAGCGCASVSLSQKEIPPGEEVELAVGARLTKEGQHLQFYVQVFSNDAFSPETLCSVTAHAPAILKTEPAQVNFGTILSQRKAMAVKNLHLLKPDGEPWPANELVSVKSQNHFVLLEKTTEESSDSAVVVKVWIAGSLTTGNFVDTITITPAGTNRSVRVPVDGNIVPTIMVVPSTIYFGAVHSTSPVSKRRFLLKRSDGKGMEDVIKIQCPAAIEVNDPKDNDSSLSSDKRILVAALNPRLLKKELDEKLFLWIRNEQTPLVLRVIASKDDGKSK